MPCDCSRGDREARGNIASPHDRSRRRLLRFDFDDPTVGKVSFFPTAILCFRTAVVQSLTFHGVGVAV